MRRIRRFSSALATVLLAAFAPAAAEVSPADEQELRELKQELWPRAYRDGDAALLDRLLAAEFQLIDPQGGWSSKAQELERVARQRWVNRSFRFEIRRLDVFENGTAVVAGRGVVIGPESDPEGGYEYQSSNVLIRRDGRWQAIASHVSGVRPLPAAELAAAGGGPAPAAGCASGPDRAALVTWSEGGFPVADDAERRRRALALVDCLGDPDPAIRDGVAFAALSSWLRAEALDAPTRQALAERLLPLVVAPEDAAGFRRSFAALALSEVARADRLAPALPAPLRAQLVEAAANFLSTTRDHRGFTPEQGWRHAVAHGADLVLQLGLHPAATEAELRRLLDALATQLAPAGTAYVHGEPERFARAVFFLHGRGLVAEDWWDAWFAALAAPAPLAAWGEAFSSAEGLARRHDVVAFLQAVAFAAGANPGPQGDRIGELARRELVRVHGG
jgi:hypothetical protein